MRFGRLERGGAATPMSDINMTPLIDVMLVLLVVFMITAPLMLTSLQLELPDAPGAAAPQPTASLAVTIDRSGRWLLGEVAVDAAELRRRVAAAARDAPQTEVQLRADKAAAYGEVAALIAAIQQAGLTRIALVTEPAAR